MHYVSFVMLGLTALSLGCAGAPARQARSAFSNYPRPYRHDSAKRAGFDALDGSLSRYVGHAVGHNPSLRARYEQWAAEIYRIDESGTLPAPQLRYTAFLRHIETKVGPQRHRFGVTQSFPWPSQLTSATDAAALRSEGARQRVEMAVLEVTYQVAKSYWELWLIERTRRVYRDQAVLLEALASAARARLETGRATVADVVQIDLGRARLDDAVAGLVERRRRAEAQLRRALSLPADRKLAINDSEPSEALPRQAAQVLRELAVRHPRAEALALEAQAQEAAANGAEAEGYPGFSLGFDYIEIGDGGGSSPDSGKDAISVTIGVKVPIWRGSYAGKAKRARAQGRALQARRQASVEQTIASVDTILASLRDSHRRARLYRTTLVVQAETALESGLAGYSSGVSPLAPVLIAQRDLLELQLGYYRAQAEHATRWAALERAVGRKVEAKEESK